MQVCMSEAAGGKTDHLAIITGNWNDIVPLTGSEPHRYPGPVHAVDVMYIASETVRGAN